MPHRHVAWAKTSGSFASVLVCDRSLHLADGLRNPPIVCQLMEHSSAPGGSA